MNEAIATLEPTISSGIQSRHSIKGKHPSVFTDIYRDEVNMVVWQRTLPMVLKQAAKQLLSAKPDLEIATEVTPQNVIESLQSSIGGYDNTGSLSEDISSLVDMFCYLFELQTVGLRMSVLDRAMCPKFHVDRVPCRLVTTYHGIATEWLDHDAVDRSKLGVGSRGKLDEQSGLFNDLRDIHRLSAGDVALLKGEAWEGNENAGLVHRSPVVLPNQSRLLITLDFVS